MRARADTAGLALSAAFASALAGAAVAQGNVAPDIARAYPDTASLAQKEMLAAVLVLAFAVLVFGTAVVLKRYADFSEDAVIRIVALVLIVTGTLFLVAIGYAAEQIAPALGILGAIAGYILGRSDRDKSKEP